MGNLELMINDYRNLINDKIKSIQLKNTPASFYEPVKYILESDGKRIRPILVMLSCQAVGGQLADCTDAALAIEILHNFTLVHDDIMDHDDLRRGRMTVHKKWDESTAILAGDGLVAMAYQYLLKTKTDRLREICNIFTTGIIDLCEGQALDKEFENRFDIDFDQYLLMIEMKTARLLMIASQIGAIIGGGDTEQVQIFKNFAKHLGCAFQIQDDLLDIERTSGKTYGSDILQKKRTYLYVHATNHADDKVRDKILNIYRQHTISLDDVSHVRELFIQAGTLDYARNEVDTRILMAKEAMYNLSTSKYRDEMINLLNWILKRNY